MVRIGHDNGDQLGLEGVPIDEDLSDEGRARINVLDFLGGHVFALGELEDVLLPVDDLQATSFDPGTHVARVEPTVGVEASLCLRLVAVVALKHGGAADTDLAARVGMVSIGVAHLGHVHQLHLAAEDGRAHVPDHRVLVVRHGDHAARLGHSVALVNLRESAPQEVVHLGGNGA